MVAVFVAAVALSCCAVAYAQPDMAGGVPSVTGEQGAKAGISVYTAMRNGGWIMAVIGVLSILSLALVIYLFYRVRPKKLLPEDFMLRLWNLVGERNHEQALRLCRETPSFISPVLEVGLRKKGRPLETVTEAMQAAGARQSAKLYQQISYLSLIATLAPMLGILGTVWGMMRTFNAVAADVEMVKQAQLASGVSQALVTTAAGLIVAIPTTFFYFYLRGRVQDIIHQAEMIASEFAERLSGRTEGS